MSSETEKKEPLNEDAGETAETTAKAGVLDKEEKTEPAAEKKNTEAKKEEPKKKEKKDAAEKLQKELDETKERLLRTVAEYDNFRKRTLKEKDAAFGNGVSHAMAGLLPVLDTLEMAAAAQSEDENYKKGVLLTLEKAQEALKNLNVQEIKAEGQPFDPAVMNAVMQEEADEAHPSGTVTKVFQKGYMLGEHIIRHATVVVAK